MIDARISVTKERRAATSLSSILNLRGLDSTMRENGLSEKCFEPLSFESPEGLATNTEVPRLAFHLPGSLPIAAVFCLFPFLLKPLERTGQFPATPFITAGSVQKMHYLERQHTPRCLFQQSVSPQKDINGFLQVLQVPVNAAQAVTEFIGSPVKFLFADNRRLLKQLAPALIEPKSCVDCFLNFPVWHKEEWGWGHEAGELGQEVCMHGESSHQPRIVA